MQTKYFKNMFQNISQGVMYSTGVADSETKNSWVACYICAGENEESLEFKAEKAFAGCKDEEGLWLREMEARQPSISLWNL